MSSKYTINIDTSNPREMKYTVTSKKTNATWTGMILLTIRPYGNLCLFLIRTINPEREIDALPVKARSLIKNRMYSRKILNVIWDWIDKEVNL